MQNETIVQLADIDVNPGKWTENADGTTTFKNNPSEWQVIGSEIYNYDTNSFSNIKAFAGTFDGRKHKIEGVYINNKQKDAVGLFSRNIGTIKNVILKNSELNGRYMIGGIVSANPTEGIIENCQNYASVSGTRGVGGISGWSAGELKNNINYGTIANAIETGWSLETEQIGGISGWITYTQIQDCYNIGEIKGSSHTGGIIGWTGANGSIINCYNIGKVSGTNNLVGGILGRYNDKPTLTNATT